MCASKTAFVGGITTWTRDLSCALFTGPRARRTRRTLHPRRVFVLQASGRDSDPSSDAQDLDRKWQEFKKKLEAQKRGPALGTRRLVDTPPLSVREIDRKTERLTNVWTSQVAYLFGAGFLLLIAAFYLYVMKEQGIF